MWRYSSTNVQSKLGKVCFYEASSNGLEILQIQVTNLSKRWQKLKIWLSIAHTFFLISVSNDTEWQKWKYKIVSLGSGNIFQALLQNLYKNTCICFEYPENTIKNITSHSKRFLICFQEHNSPWFKHQICTGGYRGEKYKI